MKQTLFIVSSLVSSTGAFTPSFTKTAPVVRKTDVAVANLDIAPTTNKPIFDPLGLYPKESPERLAGIIQPLEPSSVNTKKIILDPLQLYQQQQQQQGETMVILDEPSMSLPFLSRPLHLDGSMAGDRGFDPFNLASNPQSLLKYRNSELKHARLAMLAAVGWPLAELFHSDLAGAWHLPNALNVNDRVPSILNGGLGNISPIFWISALTVAALVEAFSGVAGEIQSADLGFDPLGLSKNRATNGRFFAESELFNGRLAMLAITGFAVQEWFTGNSVVDAIPVFFKPLNVVMEQLLASGGATSL
jgi:Chlorophyll A-B binding protein